MANALLRAWRQDARLTRAEMAKMLNLTASGIKHHLTCDEERIRRWEVGEVSWPREPYRLALSELTHNDLEDLGFVPTKRGRDVQMPSPTLLDEVADSTMRRREFVGLTGAAMFGAALTPTDCPASDALASALVDYFTPSESEPLDLAVLTAAIAQAKQRYQSSRYAQVLAELPPLLRQLRAACATLEGDARLRAYALSSEAHHMAASILLKREDTGLAWLAADRSIQAAQASQLPLAIGSSSRVITRALIDGGHHQVAVRTASAAAARMDSDLKNPSGDELSIYGSLLLSGAVAAAHARNRPNVTALLDEATETAQRLGYDGNHQWTAFGPTNVSCHRVNIALRLGDAGTALEHARVITLDNLPTNERKGTLLTDTAQALLMCGQHEKSLYLVRAAAEIAREEVTGRPVALRLVRDIAATAPVSVRRQAREYAATFGVTA